MDQLQHFAEPACSCRHPGLHHLPMLSVLFHQCSTPFKKLTFAGKHQEDLKDDKLT